MYKKFLLIFSFLTVSSAHGMATEEYLLDNHDGKLAFMAAVASGDHAEAFKWQDFSGPIVKVVEPREDLLNGAYNAYNKTFFVHPDLNSWIDQLSQEERSRLYPLMLGYVRRVGRNEDLPRLSSSIRATSSQLATTLGMSYAFGSLGTLLYTSGGAAAFVPAVTAVTASSLVALPASGALVVASTPLIASYSVEFAKFTKAKKVAEVVRGHLNKKVRPQDVILV